MAAQLKISGKAVLAGAVADAASLSLHWHYDTKKMKEIIGPEGCKAPEFHSPMATQFYTSETYPGHYALGQNSLYGEQAIMTLEYLKENGGKFAGGESFAQYLLKHFEAYTGYVEHATKDFLEKAKKLRDEKKPLYPEAGADDKQTMFTYKVVPLMLLKSSFGTDEAKFLNMVNDATRAHQNTDICANFARALSIILADLQAGKKLGSTIEALVARTDIADQVKECVNWSYERRSKAVVDGDGWDESLQKYGVELSHWIFARNGGDEKFKNYAGLTCGFPGAFMAALKIVADTVEQFTDLESLKNEGLVFGIRRNILFAGDNCGRSFMVGGMLASMGCEIPDALLAKLTSKDQLIALIGEVEKLQSA